MIYFFLLVWAESGADVSDLSFGGSVSIGRSYVSGTILFSRLINCAEINSASMAIFYGVCLLCCPICCFFLLSSSVFFFFILGHSFVILV